MCLASSPSVLCFDLQDATETRSAIERIVKKYPEPYLLAFDVPTYTVLYGINSDINFYVARFIYKKPEACVSEYNVIGILCGSDRAFPNVDRRVMRC